MTDWTPDDTRLVDLARDGHEPSESDRARVRAAVWAKLGAGAGAGVAGTSVAAAKASAAGMKVIAAIVVTGALGGAGAATVRAMRPAGPGATVSIARATPPSAPAAGSPVVVAPSQTAAPSAAGASLPTGALAAAKEPPRTVASPVSRAAPIASESAVQAAAGAAPAPPAPIAPSSATTPPPVTGAPDAVVRAAVRSTSTLEAETRLVGGAVAALHAGDPARALSLLDEHARTFATGALAEERDAERVAAWCDMHRDERARESADAFLRDHARSPLAARVRSSCAYASKTNP